MLDINNPNQMQNMFWESRNSIFSFLQNLPQVDFLRIHHKRTFPKPMEYSVDTFLARSSGERQSFHLCLCLCFIVLLWLCLCFVFILCLCHVVHRNIRLTRFLPEVQGNDNLFIFVFVCVLSSYFGYVFVLSSFFVFVTLFTEIFG